MTGAASYSQLRSAFDDFLFATIGDDKNGMSLSVNSALARSGVDPWEEAATLARLPAEMATRNLASLIAALPDGPSPRLDPATTAARLIALLPRSAGADVRSRTTLVASAAVINSAAGRYAILLVVIYMILMLGTQWLRAGRQAPIQVDQAPSRTPELPSDRHPRRAPPDDDRATRSQ